MKLAVFTPLNPARSGISDYSEALLPEVARHLQVEVFIDDGYEADGFGPGIDIPVRNWREYRPEDFDETLFQFGNNPFHVYIYDLALRHPGVLLMHEVNMHHLVADATIKRNDWDAYMREVEYEGGPQALEFARRVRALECGPDYDGLPMLRRILESGKAAIAHSRYVASTLSASAQGLPISVIPHGAWIPEVNRHKYREKLGVDETSPLIGIFGFLKPYKRIRESLRAMRRLVRVEPRARMVLVGEEHPDFPVSRMVESMDLADHVQVIGYAPIEDFVQYIGACDICLNLRYPTVGETSGTLLRALGLGRAVIVSDVGAFSDFPDDVCLKVPVDAGEVDLLFEYLSLLATRPDVRRAMGDRAREWTATECSWQTVGKRFADFFRAGLSAPGVSTVSSLPPETPAGEPEPLRASAPKVEPGLADYIRGYCHDRADDAVYVETHLTRLVKTLEMTPPGGSDDSALEMGAYMHITPALKYKLGYGEVRGCYLGQVGKVDTRTVSSSSGEEFTCEVDHFDAETDVYPYPDGRFATVLCCELLEHLYEDPMHLMSEINRILREEGRLVLSTPNICSLRAVQAALLGYHPGLFHHYVIPNEKGERDPRHAREYAPRDLQALFEAAGFEVERLETGPYLERDSLEHEWVRRLLRRYELPDHLRDDALFIVGRKIGPVKQRYPSALYAGGE